MLHKILKGLILLSGLAGGVYVIGNDSFFILLNGFEARPINVVSNGRSVKHNKEQFSGTLFGVKHVVEAPIKESSLGFVLKGTVPSSNKEKSFAIIQFAGQSERVVKIGEELMRQVTLLDVLNDYVTILREGQREKISFPTERKTNLLVSHSEYTSEDRRQQTVVAKEFDQVNQQSLTASEKITQSIKVPLQKIAQSITLDMYEKSAFENQSISLGQAGLSQTSSGIQVSANSVLVNFGLEQGDTVISVNGIPSSELVNDSSAISEIRQSGDAAVLVRRGSDVMTVNIKF